MKKKFYALLFGTALVLGACGGGGDDAAEEPADNNAEQPAEGNTGGGEVATADAEALYQQSCVSCHGNELQGGVGPALTDVGSRYSAEEIASIIVNGQGSMPKGLLQGEDAQAVAAWLATMK